VRSRVRKKAGGTAGPPKLEARQGTVAGGEVRGVAGGPSSGLKNKNLGGSRGIEASENIESESNGENDIRRAASGDSV